MDKESKKPGYEYLITYQQSVEIERITDKFCDIYLSEYEFRRFRAHLRDSARSMPRNIVEGYTRVGLKDYIEFLSFSRASGEELLKDLERLAERWEIRDTRTTRETREF